MPIGIRVCVSVCVGVVLHGNGVNNSGRELEVSVSIGVVVGVSSRNNNWGDNNGADVSSTVSVVGCVITSSETSSRSTVRRVSLVKDLSLSGNSAVGVSSSIHSNVGVSTSISSEPRDIGPADVGALDSSNHTQTEQHSQDNSEETQAAQKTPTGGSAAFAGLDRVLSSWGFSPSLNSLVVVDLVVARSLVLFNDISLDGVDSVILVNSLDLGSGDSWSNKGGDDSWGDNGGNWGNIPDFADFTVFGGVPRLDD